MDVGCGLGEDIVSRLHADVRRVIGVDFSFDMLRLAQRKFRQENVSKDVSFVTADATALPFADSSLDRLSCMSVLQFVCREDTLKMFSEFRRVAKDSASIILTIRNSLSPYAITRSLAMKLARLVGKSKRLYLHYNSYHWYRRQLIEMGSEILTEYSFGLEPIACPPVLIRMIRNLEVAVAKRTRILRPFGTTYVFEVKVPTLDR